MEEFRDKVAVITGGASGIGRALAQRCADEGMKVVLADIEEQPLFKAAQELESGEARVLAVTTDVSKASDVETLAQAAVGAFGAVHLLFNNAGVTTGGLIWEQTPADWEWVLGVNLWGVIHGIRAFVPAMLEQDVECHIVNTASMAGLISGPGTGPYRVSKFGVIALSETLYHDLDHIDSKVNVSVLCPGGVRTGIVDSGRNRPARLTDDSAKQSRSPEGRELFEGVRRMVESGITPVTVGERVFEAIRNKEFYILPTAGAINGVRLRSEAILHGRNPDTQTRIEGTGE